MCYIHARREIDLFSVHELCKFLAHWTEKNLIFNIYKRKNHFSCSVSYLIKASANTSYIRGNSFVYCRRGFLVLWYWHLRVNRTPGLLPILIKQFFGGFSVRLVFITYSTLCIYNVWLNRPLMINNGCFSVKIFNH